MTFFFVVGAAIFALLFILLGYFLGNYEGKKVYRELLCYRQSRIDQLLDKVQALEKQQAPKAWPRETATSTVADLTRSMQQAVTVKEYNYYVRLLRSAGSALMRTPLRTEHVHADYQCKQQDVPSFWP